MNLLQTVGLVAPRKPMVTDFVSCCETVSSSCCGTSQTRAIPCCPPQPQPFAASGVRSPKYLPTTEVGPRGPVVKVRASPSDGSSAAGQLRSHDRCAQARRKNPPPAILGSIRNNRRSARVRRGGRGSKPSSTSPNPRFHDVATPALRAFVVRTVGTAWHAGIPARRIRPIIPWARAGRQAMPKYG